MNHAAHTDMPDDWADSMASWGAENAAELKHYDGRAHRALPLPADRMWSPRRCSAEMAREQALAQFHNDDCGFPFEAASSCTEIGAEPEPQTESADSEVAWFIAKLVAAIVAAVYIVSSYASR